MIVKPFRELSMKSGKTAKWILLLCCLGAGSIWAETAEQLIAQGDRYWAEQKTEMAEQQFKAAIEMARLCALLGDPPKAPSPAVPRDSTEGS